MDDELEVEGGAEPADGDSIGDDHAVGHPNCRKRRDNAKNGLHLEDSEGNSPSNRIYRNDGRSDDNAVLPELWPQVDHGPSLVHERTLNADDQEEGEDSRGDADVVVGSRNMAVVSAPEGIEVVERGRVVDAQQGHADGANKKTGDVEEV